MNEMTITSAQYFADTLGDGNISVGYIDGAEMYVP